MRIEIRPIQLPADHDALLQLDTSFTTERIYRVAATATAVTLVEEALQAPLRKSFALDDELGADRLWEHGVVAEEQATIVGFAALRMERWNRRAAIWHLYIAPDQRGNGLGRRLIDALESHARTIGARCLWLETSNVNVPAIQFYRRLGFRWCGHDQSLYDPDSDAGGETALYFARAIG